MQQKLLLFLLFFSAVRLLPAQMFVGQDTLYGNEWIDYSKTHYKILVANDAVYRVTGAVLSTAGIPLSQIDAATWKLFHNGQEVPIYLSSNGTLSETDFIEFWGQKNRVEVDSQLFDNPAAELVNPWYSLFNDTAAYYLTWSTQTPSQRYTALPNDLTNAPAPEQWGWRTVTTPLTTTFYKRDIAPEIKYSWFNGDGFGGAYTNTNAFTFTPSQLYTGGPQTATVRLRYGSNLGAHTLNVVLHDSLYFSDAFFNWRLFDRKATVALNRLNPSLSIKLVGGNDAGDRGFVSGYEVRYPGTMTFSGQLAQFELEPSVENKYLELSGIQTTGGAPVLYDLTNKKRVQTVIDGGKVKALLDGSAVLRQIVVATPGQGVVSIGSLIPVQFTDLNAGAEANYIIISNPSLYSDPEANGADHVAEYIAYRESPAGGNYKVTLVNIHDLYEQFSYGIRFHPIAVRNFCHYIHKEWEAPQQLFFIGKGLNYNLFRTAAQQNLLADSLFYVPMYGSPAVDQSFVMRRGGLSAPLMGVGRIAVRKPKQIRDYLDKVIEYEAEIASTPYTLEDRAWMKRVVHVSGGGAAEAGVIKAYSEGMANVLRNNRYGADVFTFEKTSNDPVQAASYTELKRLMKDGIPLWMIFGHSGPTIVDYDIGAANGYQNSPKYPYMMVMGCQAGTCAIPAVTLGEEYTLTPKSGAIAFTASANYSFIDGLYQYGLRFYERLGGVDFGKTIGELTQHTTGSYLNALSPSLIAILHQNVLQGDPALRIFAPEGPDYVINSRSVKFDPNPVSIEQEQYQINFEINNLGENVQQDMTVKVVRELPDQSQQTVLTDTIQAPALKKQLSYTVSNPDAKSGFLRYYITADSDNDIPEAPAAAELNNVVKDNNGQDGVEVYFYSDDIQPVFPPDFSIQGKDTLTLFASALSNATQPVRYIFEIDTLETFSSTFKRQTSIMQSGGLMRWKIPVLTPDSTVLYWRVAKDTLVNNDLPWHTRSFLYLKDSPDGWNQSHYGQYRGNVMANLNAVDSTRQVEFINNANYVLVRVEYRNPNTYSGITNGFYEGQLSNYQFVSIYGINRGLCLMVHDPATGHVIKDSVSGSWGNTRFFFHFNTNDSLQRIALMDFIENEIPDQSVVGVLGTHYANDVIGYGIQNWAKDSISYGKNLFQVFEQLGAKHVRELLNYPGVSPAYGFVFRKNDPDYAAVDTLISIVGPVAEIRGDFQARWFTGEWDTKQIGPARAWRSLHFHPAPTDNFSDQTQVSLFGVRPGGGDSLLMTFTHSIDTALTAYSTADFPWLKVRYSVLDTLNHSATPLDYVRVLYDPYPEGAVDAGAFRDFFADTLQQGQILRSNVAFANISNAPFDSLKVQFRIEGANGSVKNILQNLSALAPGDTLHTDLSLDTRDLAGAQRLLIDVNPGLAHPELFHFNNVAFERFYVGRDNRNPLLDVTFDGTHLMDGDLISPKPEVVMRIRDENPYLALKDTSLFEMKVTRPDGSQHTLFFNDPSVMFFAADEAQLEKKNEARVEWRPYLTDDGLYQLSIQGRDASGNTSANIAYTVNFKVINSSSLSNLLNYPNPFSTSTCFYYTMTGLETPANFRLQIMTVSGKVVREVTESEFGTLRAGTHQSQFCWDGKDEFGDQLANGVYLYRIVAKKADGSPFEFFDNTSIDGYFKNGFGKMVLMR